MASKAEREEKKAAAGNAHLHNEFILPSQGLEEFDLGCELLVAGTRKRNIPSYCLKNLRLPLEVKFIFG